jgi:hypothetical protein
LRRQPKNPNKQQSYKFPFHYPFCFYKAMAAMAAAPIIPAPTLKPLPAFFVTVAGAEVEATEDADEAALLAGTALDPAVIDVTGALADVAEVTTDEATEAAEETADATVDATEAGLVEAPLARAAEQISLATLLVAVA